MIISAVNLRSGIENCSNILFVKVRTFRFNEIIYKKFISFCIVSFYLVTLILHQEGFEFHVF